jgi:hypothetical protein
MRGEHFIFEKCYIFGGAARVYVFLGRNILIQYYPVESILYLLLPWEHKKWFAPREIAPLFSVANS